MRRWFVLFVVVPAAAGLLVACGGNEEFPVGTFLSTASVNGLGPVTTTYHDDGTLTVEQGELVVEGTYAVDGDQVTLSDTYRGESEGQETATYTWEWDGSVLAMTTADDACGSRATAVAEMTPVE